MLQASSGKNIKYEQEQNTPGPSLSAEPLDRQESHAKTPCAFLIVNMNEQAGSILDIRCGIGQNDDAVATRGCTFSHRTASL